MICIMDNKNYLRGIQDNKTSVSEERRGRAGGPGSPAMDISVEDRLNLKKLISEGECEDNTEHIRKVKHSEKIRDDIRALDTLKNSELALKKSDPNKFEDLARSTSPFLFNNYTDIFNKVLNDELDFGIMTKLLTVLKLIEDEKVDQHEGSVLVGRILKELYVDSAMKRGERLDKEHESEKVPQVVAKDISWKSFRNSGALSNART